MEGTWCPWLTKTTTERHRQGFSWGWLSPPPFSKFEALWHSFNSVQLDSRHTPGFPHQVFSRVLALTFFQCCLQKGATPEPSCHSEACQGRFFCRGPKIKATSCLEILEHEKEGESASGTSGGTGPKLFPRWEWARTLPLCSAPHQRAASMTSGRISARAYPNIRFLNANSQFTWHNILFWFTHTSEISHPDNN